MAAPSTNGNDTRPSRRQLLRERQAYFERMQQAEQLLSIQESWYSSWGTGPWGWMDYTGWTSGEPGGRLWIPIGAGAGGRDTRRHGNNGPFIETPEQLDQSRLMARVLAQNCPQAIGVLETVKDFVVGEGMLPRVTSRELKADDPFIAAVQDVLDEFMDDNEFDELQQELVGRVVTDGEYFLRNHVEGDRLLLRVLEPEHIVRPQGLSDEWSWGIRTAEGDVSRPLEYACNYGDPADPEPVPANEIQHAKANVVRNVKRGLSDFYATEGQFKDVQKLLKCMVVGEGIKASIPGFWEYEAASQSQVQAHIATKRNQVQLGTDPITGKEVNATRYDPGSIIHSPKGKKFVGMPSTQGTANHVATVQAVLRGLLIRWGMPEYFSGDSSNANFASTLVSGSPFVRRVKRWQKFFRVRFLRTLWAALRVAYDAGRLGAKYTWEQIKFVIDVQLEATLPILAQEFTEAQVAEIEHRNGVLSKQTWRQRRGYDNEQERMNLAEEPATQLGVPGFPGLDVPDVPPPDITTSEPQDRNELRSTVGGATALTGLQTAYYANTLPRAAAIQNAMMLFGFSREEAEALFPEKPPDAPTNPESPDTAKPAGRGGAGVRPFFPRRSAASAKPAT